MPITLFEAWIAVRGLSLAATARLTGLNRNSLLNLVEDPTRARTSTLEAIAAAIPAEERATAEQVRALAARRVRNPDRVSEEIREAMAAGLRVG